MPPKIERSCVEGLEPRLVMSSSFEVAPRELLQTARAIDSVVTADFDGDGDLDIAASAGRWLITLTNRGDGTFENARRTRLDGRIGRLVGGDFDGDGDTDLAGLGGTVANRKRTTPDALRLLSNEGGTFEATRAYRAYADPYGPAQSADFDGDGRDELVFLGAIGGRGTGLRIVALGDRRLASVVDIPNVYASSVAIGDIDGDTDLDLAYADFRGVGIVENRGDGGFSARVATEIPSITTRSVLLHDMDADGDLDLLLSRVSTEDGEAVAVVELASNDGGGGFGTAERLWSATQAELAPRVRGAAGIAWPNRLVDVRVAGVTDVNGDGRLDLLVEPRMWAALLVTPFRAGPAFRPDQSPAIGRPRNVTIVPFPGEPNYQAASIVPVVATDEGYEAGPLDVLPAVRGQLLRSPAQRSSRPTFTLADLDGDGRTDVVRAGGSDFFRGDRLDAALNTPADKRPVRLPGLDLTPILILPPEGSFELSAGRFFDPDEIRGGGVDRVNFYFDTDGSGTWTPGDELVSTAVEATDRTWTGTVQMREAWRGRSVRFFAVAVDEGGLPGEPVSIFGSSFLAG